MLGLRDILEEERSYFLRLRRKLEEISIEKQSVLPLGTLRISSSRGFPRYYVKDELGNYTYVKKADTEIPKALAQREYEQRVRKLVEKRIIQLDKILKDYRDNEIDKLYEGEHKYRRCMIEPIEETWEMRLQKWKMETYDGKEFQVGTPVIMTEKGERVRSKSEKILADYFYHKGIIYKYEKPLNLKNGLRIYPDFTFLSKRIGKELYWEHDGQMDNPDYAKSAIRKIDAYIKNGILPGEQLIITYETMTYPLQMDCVEILVNKFL